MQLLKIFLGPNMFVWSVNYTLEITDSEEQVTLQISQDKENQRVREGWEPKNNSWSFYETKKKRKKLKLRPPHGHSGASA